MTATLPTPSPGPARGLVRHSLAALYPRVGGTAGVDETGIDSFLDRLYAEAPPLIWWGLVAASLAYQCSPVLTVYRPLPAAWLRPIMADTHADRACRTRVYVLRQACFLLKTFGGMCWGADPEVRKSIGWSGH
ncbi:MAG: hypothetical protein AB8H79_10580 [Myxococcota bacterium]